MALVDILKKPNLAPPAPPVHNGIAGGLRCVELSGHVGFDSLPDQLVAKVGQIGFTFNLLCVGETGIGKSTMMESLFNMQLDLTPCSFELGTVELKSNTYDVTEGNVKLKLTIVETAGFGDQLDKEKSGKVIVDYINGQFEAYLQEELKIKRHLATYKDTRIHACIYFISPTGHGLKALDVSVMKELASKVNVVPVIAKADTISKDELKRFKVKIMSDLKSQGIETYTFPTDDETVSEINTKLNALMPFAVVGSTDFVKKNGKQVRARNYPWGIVEVENEEHCDFVQLREALLRTNVEDLREKTHLVLYETYRRQRLVQMGIKDGDVGPGLKASYVQKRAEHLAGLKAKEEESKKDFIARVTVKEEELKEMERQMKAKAEAQKVKYQGELTKLEEEERKLHEEMADFERKKNQFAGTLNKKNKIK